MAEANAMIRDLCAKDRMLLYFDSAAPLLGDDGEPNANLFLDDRLHLNGEGINLDGGDSAVIEKALRAVLR